MSGVAFFLQHNHSDAFVAVDGLSEVSEGRRHRRGFRTPDVGLPPPTVVIVLGDERTRYLSRLPVIVVFAGNLRRTKAALGR